MASIAGHGYHAPQYYQTQPHAHPSNPPYGNVYYAVHDASHQQSYESRKRGYEVLNEFFGDLKRRQIDPTSYPAVGQRLLSLQSLPLPLAGTAVPVADCQTAPVMATSTQGYQSQPPPPQQYHLPPIPTLRTKNELLDVDRYLQQMQTTVYESDAASGLTQSGVHYVHPGVGYRTHSPPSLHPQPPSHPSSASRSPPHDISTPTLSPPSSVQSYASQSPITHSLSPSAVSASSQSQTHSSTALYPTLPATSNGMGYSSVSSAPASTLSGMFDQDDRRCYTGGQLQRSRPADNENEEQKLSSLIDPALEKQNRGGGSPDESERGSQSPADSGTTTPRAGETGISFEKCVANMRLLDSLREYIRHRLERGEFEGKDEKKGEDRMEGIEMGIALVAQHNQEQEREREQVSSSGESEKEALYPVLKMELEA